MNFNNKHHPKPTPANVWTCLDKIQTATEATTESKNLKLLDRMSYDEDMRVEHEFTRLFLILKYKLKKDPADLALISHSKISALIDEIRREAKGIVITQIAVIIIIYGIMYTLPFFGWYWYFTDRECFLASIGLLISFLVIGHILILYYACALSLCERHTWLLSAQYLLYLRRIRQQERDGFPSKELFDTIQDYGKL